MPQWVFRLFRFSIACLFLGQAWLHFFWPTPYEALAPQLPGEFKSLDLELVAKGLGGFYLLSGVFVLIGRPKFLVAIILLLTIVPLGLLDYSWARAGAAPVVSLVGGAALWLAPVALFCALLNWNSLTKFLLRFGLTASFATFGILASGLQFTHFVPNLGELELGLPQSESWTAAIAQFFPEVDEKYRELGLGIAGGIMLAAVLGLWFRWASGASAVFLAFFALIGVAAITAANFNSDIVGSLHRWLPESICRLSFAILPIVLWRAAVFVPDETEDEPEEPPSKKPKKRRKRKKLRRVETPAEIAASEVKVSADEVG